MPTEGELVAHGRTEAEIRDFIGADVLIYQELAAMKRVLAELNPSLDGVVERPDRRVPGLREVVGDLTGSSRQWPPRPRSTACYG